MIHEQNLRVEGVVEGVRMPTPSSARSAATRRTLEETKRVDALVARERGAGRRAPRRASAQQYYHGEGNRLRDQSRFVTRLSTGC